MIYEVELPDFNFERPDIGTKVNVLLENNIRQEGWYLFSRTGKILCYQPRDGVNKPYPGSARLDTFQIGEKIHNYLATSSPDVTYRVDSKIILTKPVSRRALEQLASKQKPWEKFLHAPQATELDNVGVHYGIHRLEAKKRYYKPRFFNPHPKKIR